MKLAERVSGLIASRPPERLREDALRLMSQLADYEGPQDFMTSQDVATICAGLISELTRTAPADAPRIIKKVITDHISVRSRVG